MLESYDVKSVRSIFMNHQWLLQEQGQVEVIRFMWIIIKEVSKLVVVVSCHETKLAKHVKEVKEKKTRRGKERPFIDCHLLLQALLLSTHVPLSLLLQDLQEMEI